MDIETAYNKALDYLYSFVDYSLKHSSELAKAEFNLDRMFALMEELGNRAFLGGPNTCPSICSQGEETVISWTADTAALTIRAANRGIEQQRYNLEGMYFDERVPQGEEAPRLTANTLPATWARSPRRANALMSNSPIS